MVDYLEETRKKNKSKISKTNSSKGSTVNGARKKTTVVKVTKKATKVPTKPKAPVKKAKKGLLARKPKKVATKVATTTRTQTIPYQTKKAPKPKVTQRKPKEIVKDVSNRDIKAFEHKEKIRRADIKKNALMVFKVLVVLAVFGIITYRYTLINASLAEKEVLKSKLEAINKENAQLEVTIESGMNINMIEQLAKELLGMQKLDNNQKVYVNIEKKDYTESSKNNVLIETESWWDKFVKILSGK